ncbi:MULTISPECIES: MATE family efflux transporter [unclassified Lactococcus]|uniref:MATE family efflux transporter n=1 Tax=unclassified Lactococcus TaxID=2643510 RepID=UPI0011CBD3D4|nr:MULTISPECIES: MATE family efflux transporter [unclassified Lactococcus]MQW22830.1 MATE family efflux transporter [Lactococcus sp. dk101]TXK44619.1 MATE family efflux transporter [Lactococcus sp. dk310]TXK50472.1 MATE family efflux transporter [Lactococcus sp. dk322]
MKEHFWKTVAAIALPVAIQGLLYTLLNILDQIMVAQKGNAAVVAVGLASKDFGILNFSLMGLTGGLAILSAQLIGNHKEEKIAKIQGLTLFSGLLLTVIFMMISLVFPAWNMRLFTADPTVIQLGIQYHRAIALGYLPVLITMVYSTVLRNAKIVKLPMYAGMGAVLLNALLNYLLIFGKLGMPALGIFGSGLATTIAQYVECILLLAVIFRKKLVGSYHFKSLIGFTKYDADIKLFWVLTLPMLIEELSFILADTVDNSIYGFMGTKQTVAVTIMGPVQGLIISFFGGFATAASVLIGNHLGRNENQEAYQAAKKILVVGSLLPLIVGILYLSVNSWYLGLYHLPAYSYQLSQILMFVMVLMLPFKVSNMIITTGILSAGGETKFVLYQSIFGSWVFAIPLGLLTAFVFKLPIYWVFLAISFEEIVRLGLCIWKMTTKTWLNNLIE